MSEDLLKRWTLIERYRDPLSDPEMTAVNLELMQVEDQISQLELKKSQLVLKRQEIDARCRGKPMPVTPKPPGWA